MQVQDIGDLTGPVLVWGGALSNLQATRALFDLADAAGIPAAQRISTGDSIGYCADPVATWDLIASRGGPGIAGNVERQLAARAGDCGCGFPAGSTCDLLSHGWYGHADRAVDGAVRDAIAALPDVLTFRHRGSRVAVVHGGVTDIARFLWPVSTEAEFAEEIAALEAAAGPVDVILAGHAGIGFERRIGDRLWLNAGVIGMPPNDGRPGGVYALLGAGRPRLCRFDYDHAAAAHAMRAAGLVQGYDRALETGYWPSEDVLPDALRREPQPLSASG